MIIITIIAITVLTYKKLIPTVYANGFYGSGSDRT